MAVHLSNRQKALLLDRAKFRRRLVRLLKILDLTGAEVSVSVVGDAEIRRINREYRGVDTPTNVLAFALEENGEGWPTLEIRGAPRVLGDIVLSADTIIREAPPLGYTAEEMLFFYLIHGLLHLLGYDHERGPAEAARQEAETDRLWQLLDI
ncbi:MAG: rRNA maturation RNase YbeY [Candidatus Adiutrix sp.]|nr:rRNA maturation RNase YbeY [Candidatus Adiutrix sp.]